MTLAHVRIEIEKTGYGWAAEIETPSRAIPRILAATPDALFVECLSRIAEIESPHEQRPPRVVAQPVTASRLLPPVSRRTKTRRAAEARDGLLRIETEQPQEVA